MSALAQSTAEALEAKHRADVLYNALKQSVAALKKTGADTTKLDKILKEYK